MATSSGVPLNVPLNEIKGMRSIPEVSVVVPAYNRAGLIHRSLSSVLGQTHEDLEIIVVDDASTDDTEAAVREFHDPRIAYVKHDHNRGPSASRNTGIKAARGEYVAFLDSDDEWYPDKLAKQMPAFASDPAVGLVYCGWSWHRSDGSVRISRVPDEETGLIKDCPRWLFNIVQDVIVRRDLATTCLMNESIWAYENLEWLLRLMSRTQASHVGEVLVRCHDHSAKRASDSGAKKLHGLEYVLDNYEPVMKKHPKALFSLRLSAGALSMKAGSKRARKHLASAARLRPLSMRVWLRLLRAYSMRMQENS